MDNHISSSLYLFLLCFFFVSSLVPALQALVPNSNVTRRRVPVHHDLSLDFYSKTCPQVDQIISSVTATRYRDSPAAGAATIRLFFHDCFVEGCDASILIAPTPGRTTKVEREMDDNKNLPAGAFETVNMAKAAVENKCPGVVSCADILAIAARDFVRLAGGPYYTVKKGRKDSKVSLTGKVQRNLPRTNSTVDQLLRLFSSKGLTATDMVALSGAHTIGFSHCDQFASRLYDFHGTKRPDPSMDARLLKALRMSCPQFGGNADVVAPCDVKTPFDFDHAYYGNLESNLGLLATDQALFLDPRTRPIVQEMGRDKARFFDAFCTGMEKMGSIRIKKGSRGEIRKDCSKYLN
jgi:peroxidase